MNRRTTIRRAFTLIELLAVIAIIAILAALLFPMVGKALERGKKAQCLSNMRQWGQAITGYLTDHNGVFPEEGTPAPNVINYENTNAWFNALAQYLGAPSLVSLMEADQAPQPQKGDKSLFTCPSFRFEDLSTVPPDEIPVFSYAFNLWIEHGNRESENPGGKTAFGLMLRISQITKPSRFAVFGEVASVNNANMSAMHIAYRHDGTNSTHIVLADGHVESFNRTNVFVAVGESNDKSINRGVIWNPEGVPPQSDPRW